MKRVILDIDDDLFGALSVTAMGFGDDDIIHVKSEVFDLDEGTHLTLKGRKSESIDNVLQNHSGRKM